MIEIIPVLPAGASPLRVCELHRFPGYRIRVSSALMLRKFALSLAAVAAIASTSASEALAQNPPDTSWQTNGVVRTIAISNGVVFLGGQFSSMRPAGAPIGAPSTVVRHNAAALDVTTGALLPWNPNVTGRVDAIRANATRVYLGGLFTKVGGVAHANAAAVGPDKGGIANWRADTNASVRSLALTPSGNVLMGGEFTAVNGVSRAHLAQVTATSAVTAWAPKVGQISGFACPPRCHPTVFSIKLSSDQKSVYFGGHFGLVNGVARNEAAEVSLSGGALMAFNPDIYADANCPACTTPETSRVYNIIPTATRIYTCGGYWQVNGTARSFNVSAFDPATGKLVSAFRGQDDGDTPGCALRNNVLYVGGHFLVAGFNCQPNALQFCTNRLHVAALRADTGAVIQTWNPTANSNHGILAIAAGTNAVAFGGYFTRIGGTDREGVALFHTLPTAP